jgi:putative ABC transport system substrate-binding protein
MKRREFITLVGGTAAAWPMVVRAQQSTIPMVALLAPGSKIDGKRFYDGFPAGMRERGYVEGQHYILATRYAEGDIALLPELAEELLQLRPQIIVAGTHSAISAARKFTTEIPIVGINMFDPVKDGLIVSEARPGGNVTGTRQYIEGLTGKQVELARDIVANASALGFLANPANPITVAQRREAETTAAKLRLRSVTLEVQAPEELGPAFKAFARERVDIVSVFRDALFVARRRQITTFALGARLPTIFGFREFVESGGLLSYGIDIRETYRRAAYFVDRILKGDKPADLPIEFPTKLELVVNVTTAKALDLNLSPTLLARADEVIE